MDSRLIKTASTEPSQKKTHYFIFDNLKFLLIVLVVIGHMADKYTNLNAPETTAFMMIKSIFIFIYAFHMPLFLFISGLFQQRENNGLNKNSIIYYIIIGFLLKITIGFSKMLFVEDVGAEYFSLLGQDGVFWFLFVLAGYKVLCFFIRNVKPSLILIISVLLALFSGYDNELGDWLYLSRFVVFFPFYYAGFCLRPEQVVNFCSKIYVKVFSAAAIAFWFYVCFFQFDVIYPFRGLFTGRNSFQKVNMYNCQFWDRGIAMIISFVLCISFIGISSNKKIPLITKIGGRTLQIYFWHKPLIFIFEYYLIAEKLMKTYTNSWWIIYLAIGAAASFLLSAEIFGRPLNKILSSIKNPKGAECNVG